MAEGEKNRDRDDLSDEASPYRLEKLREQGKVAQSRELNSLVGLIAAGIALMVVIKAYAPDMLSLMQDAFRTDQSAHLDFGKEDTLSDALFRALGILAKLALPVALSALVFGVISSFAQIGSIFSTTPLEPDFDRVNPLSGLQRYLSFRQVIESGRMLIKALVVGFVAYVMVKPIVMNSGMHVFMDPENLSATLWANSKSMFMALCGALLVFSGLDFWLQRWEYSKNTRVTKQEAKEEHKEHEGDPLIRARIRSVQKEMARKRMLEDVKKANVVITNPTHIAVAIVYDREKMDAPRVVAKGADFLAQKIKQVAFDNNIPLVENVPLARTLYKTVKIGKTIPRALYQAVAEVLAYVFKLRKNPWQT